VPAKRIDVLLDAVARLRPTPTLLLGGSRAEMWRSIAEHRYGIGDRVVAIDWSPVDALDRQIAACDVVVNLRHPNMGETSGIANRTLAAPRPLVVSTGGWFDELPDEAVIRVAPGDDEATDLADVLVRLGDTTTAEPILRQSLTIFDAGPRSARRAWHTGAVALANVLTDTGRYDEAAALLGADAAFDERYDTPYAEELRRAAIDKLTAARAIPPL